jgi:hypothetical protein
MTLTELETLLDNGKLQVWCGTAWYDARRNGKTKTWVRQPSRFEVPIKVGFRICSRITHADLANATVRERPSFRPDLTAKANINLQRGYA